MKKLALALVGALLAHPNIHAADFKKAHARGTQVKLVTTAGKTITVREKYPVREVRVAPDGKTVAWLLDDLSPEEAAGAVGAATLVVYSKAVRRTLPCPQLIRGYWFARAGKHIAYDCGGRHFEGQEVLFDTRTLKEIERFHQADVAPGKRPAWSSSGPGAQ